ncbi:D-glycero-beta-D-manno-heptose 1-phosphate adenylyltransferase [Micromonospora echinofusca]|uniref:D-glycero-beta-D-manno-heptose 1-phosphate adenylyltransferase n=1 Tax=Micromonospora echinofusca TaxID=47858 RepID=A0ABS3VT32_MICEH|nr:D-glycero-beta-D-manno-heptose 1-phosphate adenylyltransferase [Micromonospora echinofusca]MBO4207613.1 D-glycero-beta-D-manno-heptose 1-phosphate adenylyltransferase [Micromonospora echinofusca]
MAGAAEQRRLAAVVESWLGRPVLVIGDAMLDEWRFADSDRLCREAPAPVLTLRRRIAAAGGAANTAVNLAALGGRAALVAPIGADVAGDELHDCLDRAGVWDRTVSQPGRPTPVKRRLLAADQILLREDSGEPDGFPADATARLLTALACTTEELRAAAGGAAPTLVVCDYGLGALNAPVRDWLVRNRDRFATVALDAHDLADWRGLAPTVVTPSFAEATRLLARTAGPDSGLHLDSSERTAPEPPDLAIGVAPGPAITAGPTAGNGLTAGPTGGNGITTGPTAGNAVTAGPAGEPTTAEERGLPAAIRTGVTVPVGDPAVADRVVLAESQLAALRERTGADVVAVTLDTEGAVVGGADGTPSRSHTTPVPASHAVGAGDAYLAAMTLALAADAPLSTAAQLAQLAATITVSGTGTCVCQRDSLLAALSDEPETPPDGVVVDPGQLAVLVDEARRAGRSVVFTNGCFDVLHRGHVRYLEQARQQGDLLVVAVNSDSSVRRLKGPDRPVNPVEDRVAVLAALGCVDHVVVFEEDSPESLIETVRPDVYVKGGDYPSELVPEAPLVRRLGGEVRTLGYVPDRSTSAIIERIRAQAAGEVLGRAPLPTESVNRGPFLTGKQS